SRFGSDLLRLGGRRSGGSPPRARRTQHRVLDWSGGRVDRSAAVDHAAGAQQDRFMRRTGSRGATEGSDAGDHDDERNYALLLSSNTRTTAPKPLRATVSGSSAQYDGLNVSRLHGPV